MNDQPAPVPGLTPISSSPEQPKVDRVKQPIFKNKKLLIAVIIFLVLIITIVIVVSIGSKKRNLSTQQQPTTSIPNRLPAIGE